MGKITSGGCEQGDEVPKNGMGKITIAGCEQGDEVPERQGNHLGGEQVRRAAARERRPEGQAVGRGRRQVTPTITGIGGQEVGTQTEIVAKRRLIFRRLPFQAWGVRKVAQKVSSVTKSENLGFFSLTSEFHCHDAGGGVSETLR